jgi:hypothetical protein
MGSAKGTTRVRRKGGGGSPETHRSSSVSFGILGFAAIIPLFVDSGEGEPLFLFPDVRSRRWTAVIGRRVLCDRGRIGWRGEETLTVRLFKLLFAVHFLTKSDPRFLGPDARRQFDIGANLQLLNASVGVCEFALEPMFLVGDQSHLLE